MYYNIFHIGNIVFYILLGISVLLLMQKIIYHIVGLFPTKKFPDAKKDHKYAILIPARNESKVIEQLLISIKEQNYNHELIDTYVIVEDEKDKTCEIAKNYQNTYIFVRQHLERKGKGHALNEVIEHIFKSNKKYEAFFICDADNVLTPNFVKEMNKTFDAGYKIALGYRNSKNWNGGYIASCSALTFSMINTFHNKCRSRFNQNVILSGTGFYISCDILEKLGGWKFFTLTEDVELSMFSTVNDIKSTYNEYAEYYDEQPSKFKASWNQRLRWVKGYSQVNKKYKKKLLKGMLFDKKNRWSKFEYTMSILPVVCILTTAFIYAFFTFVLEIVGSCIDLLIAYKVYRAFIIASLSIYFFFVCYAMVMLYAERKHTNITLKNKIICCLMFPFYMACYIPIYFTSLVKKEVEWKPIAHTVNMDMSKNKEVELNFEESKSARQIDDDESILT